MATKRRGQKVLPSRLEPRKRPRQARAQSTVDAIVEAGSRVLIARRWHAFSMQEVALTAGVSPGSLYQYFADKETLVTEIVERISERELAFHRSRLGAGAPPPSLELAIGELVRSALAFQRAEGPIMRATLEAMPFLGRYPALAERVQQLALVVRQLLEAYRSTITHPDLDMATHVLINCLHSLTHDGILPRPALLDDESLEAEVLRFVRGYLGLS